jgi:hypothetical protein
MRRVLPAITLGLLLAPASSRAGQLYTFSMFEVPGSDPGTTLAGNITSDGQIAGNFTFQGKGDWGFPRSADGLNYKTFEFPGLTINGVNNAGFVVGSFSYLNKYTGLTYDTRSGSMSVFQIPGLTQPVPYEINNKGDIVGNYKSGEFSKAAFIEYANGTVQTFSVPGIVNGSTLAFGINDLGQAVGEYDSPSGPRGYLRNLDGTFTTFDAPGSGLTSTYAGAINNEGQIAGIFSDSLGEHGFVLDASTMSYTIVDAPGSAGTTLVQGIDDRGRLTGSYSAPDGSSRSFIATPIPEPSSLFQGGLAVILTATLAARSHMRGLHERT